MVHCADNVYNQDTSNRLQAVERPSDLYTGPLRPDSIGGRLGTTSQRREQCRHHSARPMAGTFARSRTGGRPSAGSGRRRRPGRADRDPSARGDADRECDRLGRRARAQGVRLYRHRHHAAELGRRSGRDQVADLPRQRRARHGVAAGPAGGDGLSAFRTATPIFAHMRSLHPRCPPYAFRIIIAFVRTTRRPGMPMLPLRNSHLLRAPRVTACAALVIAVAAISTSRAAEHTLMPSPQTVHIGYFLASLKPVLTIDSGDIVTLESAAAIVPDVVDKSGVVPLSAVPQYQRDIYGQVKDRGPGPHVLTGPIEVRGAEPGDVLEVRILQIDLALDYGYNRQRAYTGALPDEFTALWTRIIPINRQAKTAEVAKGVVVPVDKPFFGIMGLAPDPGMCRISSGPPGVHSGNMDNKDLIAGTTLFMPVHAPGALFSAGDAHAAQGHGEVDLTAIETGLRGKFQFIVRKDMKLVWPRAETPTHWMVMGLHPNLEEAMKIAVRETIDFLTKRFPHLSREEAYMIASVAVDYHVTQVVDGTKGIHGMIPKAIFTAQR